MTNKAYQINVTAKDNFSGPLRAMKAEHKAFNQSLNAGNTTRQSPRPPLKDSASATPRRTARLHTTKAERVVFSPVQQDVRHYQQLSRDMLDTREQLQGLRQSLNALGQTMHNTQRPSQKQKARYAHTQREIEQLTQHYAMQQQQRSALKKTILNGGGNVPSEPTQHTPKQREPLRDIRQHYDRTRERLQQINREQDTFVQAQKDMRIYQTVNKDIAATRQQLQQALAQQQQLGKAMGKTKTPSKRLQQDYDRARTSVERLTTRYTLQQQKLSKLHKAIVSAGGDMHKLSESQRLMTAKTVVANRQLKEQQQHLERLTRIEGYLATRRQRAFEAEQRQHRQRQQLQQSLQDARAQRNDRLLNIAQAGAYLYAGSRVIQHSADLETAVVAVAKKLSFKSEAGQVLSEVQQQQQLQQVTDWISEAAPSLGMTPVELANIIASGAGANVARAGQEQQDLAQFGTLAAKMSVAFDNLNAESAGESVATWMASMRLDLPQSAELASAINHLSDNSAANTGAITELVTRSGSMLMGAGFDHRQVAAIGTAILAANGNKAEMGATAAKNLAITLTQGAAMSGTQQRVVNDLGLDPVQLAKDMHHDSVKTLYHLFERIQAKPEWQRNSIVSTLFGRESINGINPLISNLKELKRVMLASSDETAIKTSLDREFQQQQATTNFQLQRAKHSLTAFSASVGAHLLPVITQGAALIADLLSAGTTFIQEHDAIAGVIIKAVSALALLKAGMMAWRLGMSALEVLSLKRKMSEATLAATTANTTKSANLASAALARLNAMLDKTARRSGVGGGDSEPQRHPKNRRATRGKFSRFAAKHSGKLPVMGAALTAGAGVLMLSDSFATESNTQGADIGGTVGAIGGAMAGAAAGAALGSMVPIIGNVAGGIIGAIAGEELLGYFGERVGSWFDTPEKSPSTTQATAQHSSTQRLSTTATIDKQALLTAEHNRRDTFTQANGFTTLSPEPISSPAHTLSPADTKRPADTAAAQQLNIDALTVPFTTAQHSDTLATANQPAPLALSMDYRPEITIQGNADKASVDTALKASEQRLTLGLSDLLNAQHSDLLPRFA